MSTKKSIFIIIAAALIIGGAYFASLNIGSLGDNNNESREPSKPGERISLLKSNFNRDGNEFQEYRSPNYGFSFTYPKGFNMSEFDDGPGHTILVQPSVPDQHTDQRQAGEFQIYITPFDEPEPLTGARILQDMPPSEVINPKDVLIGADKSIHAVIFLSTSPSFEKTREIWFSRGENLYQVTTREGQDNLIGPILETLSFQ